MAISVKNYTNRYVAIVILIVMAVWALLFYAFIMDEVYDNIDDGLKNQKIEIIRAVYKDTTLLETTEFGINQFRITSTSDRVDIDENKFTREFIFMPYDNEKEPYRVLKTGFYSKSGKPYDLEIRTSTVEEDDFLIDLGISLVVLYFVIVLSIVLVNHYVMSKVWKPFNRILKNLTDYRFGEVKVFNGIKTNVREFDELNKNFESMISRNEKSFDDQKRFLENASHELQTPLAITIQKLELLMGDELLSEEQMVKIAEAKQSLHRMVNLNKSLLMLSRIDNDQFSNVEIVDCNLVIENLINDLEDIIDFKGVSVEWMKKGTFAVNMHPDLAIILFSNLIRNAIKYNVVGGKLIISLDTNEVTISNTSVSEALNPDYIFQRFYKGKQDNKSNGLGLSIVESILNKYSFLSIEYAYAKDFHVFSVKK